jgi:hypothetical protein
MLSSPASCAIASQDIFSFDDFVIRKNAIFLLQLNTAKNTLGDPGVASYLFNSNVDIFNVAVRYFDCNWIFFSISNTFLVEL